MKHEHSAGAIIWRNKNNETQYLLIQSQPYKQFKSAWAFSKGHLEAGETAQEAAKREIFEEVGLKPEKRIREQNFKEFSFEDLSSILAKANDYLNGH